MSLPAPRGPLSEMVFAALAGGFAPLPRICRFPLPSTEDFQITLSTLEDLAFGQLDDVDAIWDDEPSVLALRETMEAAQEWHQQRREFATARGA